MRLGKPKGAPILLLRHRTEAARPWLEEVVVQPHASRRVDLKEAKSGEKSTSAAAWNSVRRPQACEFCTDSLTLLYVDNVDILYDKMIYYESQLIAERKLCLSNEVRCRWVIRQLRSRILEVGGV